MTLRALEPEDLDMVYEIENDPTMWEVGNPAAPYSKYALRQYLAEEPTDIIMRGSLRLVIETDEGESVGLLDIMNYSPTDRSGEIGIAVRRAYRGKGMALQALSKLEAYCRDILNLCQLYARIGAANHASKKLFRDAGFEAVATLPRWHYVRGKYEDIIYVRKWLSTEGEC